MIVEHWTDDECTSVFPKGNFEYFRHTFVGTPVKCCEIEGDSWEDCMQKYHEHQGWEPYVPFDEDPAVIKMREERDHEDLLCDGHARVSPPDSGV